MGAISDCKSDGDTQREFGGGGVVGIDGLLNPLAGVFNGRLGGVWKDDRKFIPTDAGCQISFPEGFPDHPGRGDQQAIPLVVSQGRKEQKDALCKIINSYGSRG